MCRGPIEQRKPSWHGSPIPYLVLHAKTSHDRSAPGPARVPLRSDRRVPRDEVVTMDPDGPPRRTDQVPGAVNHFHEVLERIDGRTPAVFLDQDGTLAPITERPEEAVVPRATREAIERLAAVASVTIVTGRDAANARTLLGVDTVPIIGNHGLEVQAPDGTIHVVDDAKRHLGALGSVADALEERLAPIPGAWVERKRFAIVAHDRQVAAGRLDEVHEQVRAVAGDHPDLRLTVGRRIHEFRPPVAVDKGIAVRRCIDDLGGPEEVAGIYVGDDTTDEDAFYALRYDGIAVVVRDRQRLRPTWAHFGVGGPHEVPELLDLLTDVVKRGTDGSLL